MQKSVSWSNNFSMIGRSSRHKDWSRGLYIKVGRGQGDWDACVGTCDLVTQDEVWDAGTCGTGTRDVKYRDAGTSNTGTRGMLMIIAKIRVKCDISFLVKMCYLLST